MSLKFEFAEMSYYRKIVDYLAEADDTGFYIYSNNINFYPLGSSTTTYAANTPFEFDCYPSGNNRTSWSFHGIRIFRFDAYSGAAGYRLCWFINPCIKRIRRNSFWFLLR